MTMKQRVGIQYQVNKNIKSNLVNQGKVLLAAYLYDECLLNVFETAHYVDSIGYRQTPEFLQPQNYLKHVEDIVEQNDNNFDGIINNTPQTPTVGELEQKAKAGEPISLIDLANAIHADKERGKEEKPSIRAQLRAAKEQTAQRKAQRSKTQDLERI